MYGFGTTWTSRVQVWVVERDGVIELRPHVPAPAGQQWFWTERWQSREREVDAHVNE